MPAWVLVEQTLALMEGDGHALANLGEDFGHGWHWDPHTQVQFALKGNPAVNPMSGLPVTRPAGGDAWE